MKKYLLFENKEACITANNKISDNMGCPVYAKDKNGNMMNTGATERHDIPKQDINDVWFIEKPDDEFMTGVIFASGSENITLKQSEIDI